MGDGRQTCFTDFLKLADFRCFGVSVITDMGDEENIEEVNHEEVLQAAQKAEPHVRNLIKNLIARY